MAKTQKTVMEGLSVVLTTGRGADRTQLTLPSHGRKVRLDEAVASIAARRHFSGKGELKGIGVFDAAFLSDVEAIATHVATLPGGRAEVARFGLERIPRPFQVQVYERRKVTRYEPASDKVRTDHVFVQRELIETARTIVTVPERLECPCGAIPAPTDTRCTKCGRRFDEPLVARALPSSAACIAAVEACAELGLQVPKSGNPNDATCFWPANAAQSLGATAALTHLKYRLLDPKELQRRMALLRELSGWPAAYPIAGANELVAWLWALDSARVAPVLGDLEGLAKRRAALLEELSADLLEPGWNAAAHAMGPVRGELPWDLENVRKGLVRLSSLALPPRRTPPARPTMLDALRLASLDRAKGRAFAERVAASDRSWLGQGELLLALQHIDGVELWEVMRRLLENAHAVVEAMVRAWCLDGVVPAVAYLEPRALVAALETLRTHLPPAFQASLDAAARSAPPWGIPPRRAWGATPAKAKLPAARCPECNSALQGRGQVVLPESADFGARTLNFYECLTCSEEDGPGSRAKWGALVVKVLPAAGPATRLHAWDDYPAVSGAKSLVPDLFRAKPYEAFLETRQGAQRPAVKLGGYPALALGPDDAQLPCGHTPLVMEVDPRKLGLGRAPPTGAAYVTTFCATKGCRRPVALQPRS